MSEATSRLARAPWRRLTSRPVYANSWMRMREDSVELPDGRTTIYGVVECPGAVGVLPFLDPDTVMLVGQYRYIAGAFLWEMPTGGMHKGETPEAAARRELAEAAGYEAERLVRLGTFYTSKSVLDETATLYLAEGLTLAQDPRFAVEGQESRRTRRPHRGRMRRNSMFQEHSNVPGTWSEKR